MLLAAGLAPAGSCGPEPPIWPERFMIVQRKVPDNVTEQDPASVVTWYDAVAGANLIQVTAC